MGQGNRFGIGRSSLLYLKKAFAFKDMAEHAVLQYRELMALRQRNLVLIGGKYPGAIGAFRHNQCVKVWSIYYKDGLVLDRRNPNCAFPDTCLQEWTVWNGKCGQKGLINSYFSIT